MEQGGFTYFRTRALASLIPKASPGRRATITPTISSSTIPIPSILTTSTKSESQVSLREDQNQAFHTRAISTTSLASKRARSWIPPLRSTHSPGQKEKGTRSACPSDFVKAYRSEEHTSELQSQSNLVCRLL